MTDGRQLRQIALDAGLLVKNLPEPVVESLASVLWGDDPADWQSCSNRIMEGVAHPHYRNVVLSFLDDWRTKAPEVRSQAVAAALLAALSSEQSHRDGQSVELVWTGPDVDVVPLRRTEQALLQVIESATKRLTVVSYAVYHIPRISDALLRAADRGVIIRVVIETPDRTEGRKAYDTLAALGSSIASRCSVLLWPPEKRQRGDNGKLGILHVKCAVADGRWLFLSSANLTEYAFTLNMELGLLVTGGSLPSQVETHFDRMAQVGILSLS